MSQDFQGGLASSLSQHGAGSFEEHPVDVQLSSIAELERRAVYACVALGLTAVIDVIDTGLREASLWWIDSGDLERLGRLDDALNTSNIARVLLSFITAFFFLRWVHRLVWLTRTFNGRSLRWKAREAVWLFIVPILSFFRPYQVMRDVQQQLLQQNLPEPEPVASPNEATGYRDMPLRLPPQRAPIPNAVLGWWWAAFVLMQLLMRVASKLPVNDVASLTRAYRTAEMQNIIALVAAFLAIRVVRNLTLRVRDLASRARAVSPEALRGAGFVIDPSL